MSWIFRGSRSASCSWKATIGISPADQTRLFDSFTQADGSASRRFGRSGLGLAISKKLVELMDGRIGLQSGPGEGSRFIVELPCIKDTRQHTVHETDTSAAQPNKRSASHVPQYSQARVLLVEDNPINQELAGEMLEQMGCQVEVAANGRDALAAIGREACDLVLMDCPFTIPLQEVSAVNLVTPDSSGGLARPERDPVQTPPHNPNLRMRGRMAELNFQQPALRLNNTRTSCSMHGLTMRSVESPARQRLATGRNRVLSSPGVAPAAKRAHAASLSLESDIL